MVSIKLYVEGGGEAKSLKSELRRGFRRFLKKAHFEGNMPGIVACGGRDAAFDRFSLAHMDRDTVAILLVDSEGPVTANGPWQHLKYRDNWTRPPGVEDDQCHLMVQIMESWFLADREALAEYYGPGFRSDAIPSWPDIEQVPKSDVLEKLGRATRGTRKRSYEKGRDSFKILGRLDANKVTNASPYAKSFVGSLKKLGSSP